MKLLNLAYYLKIYTENWIKYKSKNACDTQLIYVIGLYNVLYTLLKIHVKIQVTEVYFGDFFIRRRFAK